MTLRWWRHVIPVMSRHDTCHSSHLTHSHCDLCHQSRENDTADTDPAQISQENKTEWKAFPVDKKDLLKQICLIEFFTFTSNILHNSVQLWIEFQVFFTGLRSKVKCSVLIRWKTDPSHCAAVSISDVRADDPPVRTNCLVTPGLSNDSNALRVGLGG